MVRFFLGFLAVAMVLPVSVARAGPPGEDAPVHVLPETVILSSPDRPGVYRIEDSSEISGTYVNLAEALQELPGVNGLKRSQSVPEPVIRGLGWERVQTQAEGLPLYGACPARMDPPASMVHAFGARAAIVVKSLPSVTLGPFGTAGRVEVSLDEAPGPADTKKIGGFVEGGYDSARSGGKGEASVRGSTGRFDYGAGAGGLSYGDYSSADGVEVPAGQVDWGGAVTLGYRPVPSQRVHVGFYGLEDEGTDYPALPMDSDHTSFRVYHTGYRIEPTRGRIGRFSIRAGYGSVDHRMSNRNKSNRSKLEAETDAQSDSVSSGVALDIRLSDAVDLTTGLDFFHLWRDARRVRRVVASGTTFRDRLWPDALQWDVGGFAELNAELHPGWNLRVGGRVDHARSDARAVDEPGLGGRSIRENYVFYYGPQAAEIPAAETLGAGNALLEWSPFPSVSTHLGIGISSRPAALTERYFSFAPAPGGFQVGNPSLRPETRYEVAGGAIWYHRFASISLDLFHDWFDDYIYQAAIDFRDVNGDGVEDTIRGFRNVAARLYGAELALVLKPLESLTFPLSLAYVRGENDTDGSNLPEIPPLEIRAACRFAWEAPFAGWVEFGGRFADRQTRIDPRFPENVTPGFAVLHCRAEAEVARGLSVRLGVENLLDAEYHEHLTREAALDAGGLRKGDEIPEPGRHVFVSLRYAF